jgi:hypothetical protein
VIAEARVQSGQEVQVALIRFTPDFEGWWTVPRWEARVQAMLRTKGITGARVSRDRGTINISLLGADDPMDPIAQASIIRDVEEYLARAALGDVETPRHVSIHVTGDHNAVATDNGVALVLHADQRISTLITQLEHAVDAANESHAAKATARTALQRLRENVTLENVTNVLSTMSSLASIYASTHPDLVKLLAYVSAALPS